MKDYKTWKEELAPAIIANDEHPSSEDMQFFHNPIIKGKILSYINWFAQEMKRDVPELTTVKKAFILNHIMQAINADPSKVYRILNNPQFKKII